MNVVSPFQDLNGLIVDYAQPCALSALLCLRIFIRIFFSLFDLRPVAWRPTHLADRAVGFILVAGFVHLCDTVKVVICRHYAG